LLQCAIEAMTIEIVDGNLLQFAIENDNFR
jgi:hypothetical protein